VAARAFETAPAKHAQTDWSLFKIFLACLAPDAADKKKPPGGSQSGQVISHRTTVSEWGEAFEADGPVGLKQKAGGKDLARE
jgi:hypothetical protein